MENYNPRQFVALLSGTMLREAEFHFEETHRRALLAVIKEHRTEISAEHTDAFIVDMELAIARYTTGQALEKEKRRESALRDQLKELDAAATELQVALGKYNDPDSRFVLEHCLQYALACPTVIPMPDSEEAMLAEIHAARQQGVAAKNFIADFTHYLAILREGITLSNNIKFDIKTGPRQNKLRMVLATDVATLFQSHLGIAPTTTQEGDFTEEGPFTEVLRVVLRAVGIETKDLHRLVGDAVRQAKAVKS